MSTKAKATSSAKKTPAAVKAAPTTLAPKPETKKGSRIVPPGTMATRVGPKGGKLVEDKAADNHSVSEEQRQGERRAQSTIAQFVDSNLNTPAVHEPTAEEKRLAEYNAKMAALAAEFGQPLPTAPKARAASNKVQQNNITRPATGTLTGAVWDAADSITKSNGGQAAQIAQVRGHESLAQHNDHTIKTQFARWRAFHGVVGRAVVLKAVINPPKQGEYDGIPTVG